MIKFSVLLFLLLINHSNYSNSKIYTVDVAGKLPLHKIKLPPGFKISVFAADISDARSLTKSNNQTIFVGNRSGDKVFALKYKLQNPVAEKKYVIASGLNSPNGVAFRNGSLYVAEIDKILRFDNIENSLDNPPKPITMKVRYPSDKSHGWKFIRFGPDGNLYIPVGAPCNICDAGDPYSSITKLSSDGRTFEIVARGIRNTVGFDWHPVTGELWFTDNGRDLLGDDLPPDELNRVGLKNLHFGYPYFHGRSIPDPEFNKGKDKSNYTGPSHEFGAHVASLGMRFYTGKQFPEYYRNQIFSAEHGSWNRSKKSGYKITLVRLDGSKVIGSETFASGWLDGESVWGRPVDIEILSDGSMLVSDDYADVIYRIHYEK